MITGTKRVDWTEREDARLVHLRQVKRLKWREIAPAMPGRTLAACNARFSYLRESFTRAERHERLAPVMMRDPPRPAVQAPATAPSGRTLSTAALLVDAELRSRIAERGLTAGWFGDPPPGRSALDEKLAGLADPGKPTLADGRPR